MRTQIRNLGVFLVICYGLLFVQVNRLTVFEADELRDEPRNTREIERNLAGPRGTILTADGVLVAESVKSNDRFERQRRYPLGELFADVTGYFAIELGAAGVEKSYNAELAGDTLELDFQSLSDLFVDRERVGNLTLTLRADVQRVAAEQLGQRRGSVVALDPRSGEILALWSFPSYDPNTLATHDTAAAEAASEALAAAPGNPRLAKTYQDRFSPGSTFKIVTATAGVEQGGVTEESPDYPPSNSYLAPGVRGQPIRNFGGATCGGTLFPILEASCNTAFAQMGVEDAGPDAMVGTAEDFGFNQEVPIDLPSPAESFFPTDVAADQLLAQYSIGQNNVQATPLQMAMIAGAVANAGTVMAPHVVREVRDDLDEVVDENDPEEWTEAMSPATASLLRRGMISVVTDGTASRLNDGLEEFEVGGKTGTAQIGDTGNSHAWIIGFAGPPGDAPEVAVAVIVEGQEGASEQTGGRVAAPIAAAVMRAVLAPDTAVGSGDQGEQ